MASPTASAMSEFRQSAVPEVLTSLFSQQCRRGGETKVLRPSRAPEVVLMSAKMLASQRALLSGESRALAPAIPRGLTYPIALAPASPWVARNPTRTSVLTVLSASNPHPDVSYKSKTDRSLSVRRQCGKGGPPWTSLLAGAGRGSVDYHSLATPRLLRGICYE